ncbi:PepSY domain-containing protein [Planococcus lenghuensis]|uniref:PepSY domain-containing protein n=1 Tax=Planococcus lenghuensis TaxID=2213202 RepID=A0A1Q2L3S2_9BACL|nr:DUF5590 domain-containing protein [Planococcus lenghuensis]AQQ55100.1 hypothetical protein B0X71_11315 [Planococcus lenghuensis]
MAWWMKFVGAFLLLLAAVAGIVIAVSAVMPFTDAKRAAEEQALSGQLLMEVEETTIYNGSSQTVTVIGKGPDGARLAVFVPEDGEMTVFPLQGTVTAAQAEAAALEEAEGAEVLHVRLGPSAEGPVWEVAFKGADGRLNYVYISAEDGSWRERILNL